MVLPDLGNAAFEGFATVISMLNVWQILKDKEVKGVSAWPTIGFTMWGIWNLFYYPFLGQTYSAIAAGGMITVNATWLYLYWKYTRGTNKNFHRNPESFFRPR